MNACPFYIELTDADQSSTMIETASTAAIEAACSPAVVAVLAKRIGQVDRHGFTPAHDRDHDALDLACAAYAFATMGVNSIRGQGDMLHQLQEAQRHWPFMDGFRPSPDARENLVNAAAMILATIDRLDAGDDAAAITPERGGELGAFGVYSADAEATDDGLVELHLWKSSDAGPLREFRRFRRALLDWPHAVELLGTLARAVEKVRPASPAKELS